MPDEPLTNEECKALQVVVGGIWAMLKETEGTTAEEVLDQMKDAELHVSDGRTISFDSTEIRARLPVLLKHLAEDTRRIAGYLFEHPGKHSAAELGDITRTNDAFVEAILYKLAKAGIV